MSSTPVIVRTTDVARHGRRADIPDAILRWGLMLILAGAPLPMASIYPLASATLALAAGVLLVIAIACEAAEPSAASTVLRPPTILFAILVGWIGVQNLPLDVPGWQSTIWDEAQRALGTPLARSISVDREQSLARLLHLFCYAAIFLAAWRVGRRAEGATAIMRAVAFIGAAYASYGLIEYFSGNRMLLWYPKWAYGQDLTATFVNRNSFATLLGICLIASLGMLAQVLVSKVDGRSLRILIESSIESVIRQGWLATTFVLILGSALLFTHSRGGALATLIGAGALVGSAFAAPSLRGPWRRSLSVVVVCGTIVTVALLGSGVLSRVSGSSPDPEFRLGTYAGTLRAIGDNPVLGTGLGTFRFVYQPYQPQSVTGFVEFAHNDYLENALELGLPGAFLFYAMLSVLAVRCVMGIYARRRDAIFPCVAVGATVLVAIHATVDFSLQMPAVAATFSALLGMGVAQSVGTNARRHPTTSNPGPSSGK